MYYHKENKLQFSLSSGLDTNYFVSVSSINGDFCRNTETITIAISP